MSQSYSPKKSCLIFFSFLFFYSTFSFGSAQKVCSQAVFKGSEAQYRFESINHACSDPKDCWIQFKAPEDVFSLEVGNKSVFDLKSTQDYLSNEFFLLPVNDHVETGSILITAKDINQDIKFSPKLCLNFGKHSELRWINSQSWFFKSGVSLYSAYFLLVISFFLLFSFWLRKSPLGLSLLAYSLISAIYLISFSEYPRAFFDPVLATGGFHFPLRLMQDLSLVYVFYNFYQKYDSLNIIKILSWVYTIVIATYVLLLSIGVRDYIYFSRIIIIMAPLVAAPMAIGTWFAFKLKDPVERKVLIPLSILLLCFQLNDLLVFWKITDSFFTVKFYIPFIVGMALFLYFRRMHDEALEAKTSSQRHKIYKEFIHDVKSPLAVLRIFLSWQSEQGERKQVIDSALDRIEGMVSQIDSPLKEEIKQKILLFSSLREIVAQKKIEFPDLIINFDSSEEVYAFADKSKLQRIFSNIINNSYESYPGSHKVLDIGFLVGDEELRIRFTDKGKGIPREVLKKLFSEAVTTKENGQGIGLTSAYSYLSNLGGSLGVVSKLNHGTTVEIKLITVPGNYELPKVQVDLVSNFNVHYDFILIDDDKYIRISWEYFAINTKKSILTFSSVQQFLEVSETINKNCPIYLDLNINGEKSIKYVDSIYEAGFSNIILATGEEYFDEPLPRHIQSISGKLPPLH